MHKIAENFVFFGFSTVDEVLAKVSEPIHSVQLLTTEISKADEALLSEYFGSRFTISRSYSELKYHPFSRLVLLDSSNPMADFYYDWSGRQDFPFVVTVKESSRSAIFEKNQLAAFHPNVDLLLKELIR